MVSIWTCTGLILASILADFQYHSIARLYAWGTGYGEDDQHLAPVQNAPYSVCSIFCIDTAIPSISLVSVRGFTQ